MNCLVARCQLSTSTVTLPAPSLEGEEKIYPEKIHKIVDDISRLTLLEISDLNDLLKKRLKITETPVMQMGTAIAASPKVQEEEEVAEVKQEKTSFTVRILKFQDDKKVALIKEVKNLVSGMNLVQAKKFVESVPSIIKSDISKDEAEKLKASLTAVGASVEIE
ncbi:hypothetical protein HELRODRAFT_63014 [Helobdella robusta]|uniref:39S ribosomal protein L12, mitochondrial n=1 Tax=Helobdella robusta TaxID=6412 RepID=T1FX98_HELRO|nr:hypothetical protein HELRODRAFT_63014 [Helobdella robusta]ESO12259.1 hypothetical protein HELRODRAFT_63014 [Helobdella robusta]